MKIKYTRSLQKDPTVQQGIKVPYAPAKRHVAQWRWYLILLIVSSPLIYFLLRLGWSQVVVSAQGFLSLDKVAINATAAGVVNRMAVGVGQDVTAGQLLAELDDPTLRERLKVLQAERQSLAAPVTTFSRQASAALYMRQVQLADIAVDHQEKRLSAVTLLFEQGAATAAEVNAVRGQATAARARLNRARIDLAAHQTALNAEVAPSNRHDIMRRDTLSAQIDAIRTEQDRLKQVAVENGRILDIFVQVGESLSSGSPILLLGRADRPSVVAYLDPKYSRYARRGQTARVLMPGGKAVRARVREDARLTKRLPADLSSPIGARDVMALVKLDLIDPLDADKAIDGLPVTVRFDWQWQFDIRP